MRLKGQQSDPKNIFSHLRGECATDSSIMNRSSISETPVISIFAPNTMHENKSLGKVYGQTNVVGKDTTKPQSPNSKNTQKNNVSAPVA